MENEIIFNIDNQPCDCYKDYFDCVGKTTGEITLEFRLEIKSIYYYPKINFCPVCGKEIKT